MANSLLSGFFYRHHHQLGERGIIHPFPFDSTTRVRHLIDHVLEYAGLWLKPEEKFEELKYPKKAAFHIGFLKVDLPLEPIETIQDRVQHWLEQNCEQDPLLSHQEISKIWTNSVDPDSRIQFVVLTLDDFQYVAQIGALPDPKLEPRIVGHNARLKSMANISQLPSPSQSAIDPKSCHNIAGGVCDGRPAGFHGPPNALFDSRLAKLEEAMSNLDTIEVDKVYVEFALKLISASVAFYRQEDERERRLREIVFGSLFPNGEWQRAIKNGKPEAFWLLSLIFELKNERGVGGDARMQCIMDYLKLLNDPDQAHSFRATSCCPSILFALAGTQLDISTIIYTDAPYVDDVFSMNLRTAFDMEDQVLCLARALKVVQETFQQLQTYYHDLPTQRKHGFSSHLPSPSPTEDVSVSQVVGLSFLYKLCQITGGQANFTPSECNRNNGHAIYVAIGTRANSAIPEGQEVVVKFSRRYNVNAHRLLSEVNLAPKLYYSCQVQGGYTMCIMEYVKGETAFTALASQPDELLPRSVYQDIKKAIDILHEANLVFGDLRLPNIILWESRAMLVDFDWCGRDGVARYPVDLNVYAEGEWAEGMERYGLMKMEHDVEMLQKLETICK